MSVKVRHNTSEKKASRIKRKRRIKEKVKGTPERPRLVVFKSNSHIYAHVIDDKSGNTLASASTLSKEAGKKLGSTKAGAEEVGKLIVKMVSEKKISNVVFDRNGYLYHGKVKALADAAREAGLRF